MSILDLPRIHFNGSFSTNVCTANNADVAAVEDRFKPVVDPIKVALNDEIARMSKIEAREWFEDLTPDGRGLNGGWNPHGNNVISFRDATVSDVVTSFGQDTQGTSGLIGANVTLPGSPKMVDVDPTATSNVQLFLGGFRLDGGANFLEFKPHQGAIAYSRWISGRNISVRGFTSAAATWQFGLPKDSIQFSGNDPALVALQSASDAGQGLLVQFCTYYLQPEFESQQLHQFFKAGRKLQNPSIGHMVGTLGVWNDDELATFPNGRLFNSTEIGRQKVVGPATANVQQDENVISLNLITAIPERHVTIPDGTADGSPATRTLVTSAYPQLEKVSLGTLSLGVRPAGGGSPTVLADVPSYDSYPHYQLRSGIVDIAFDASHAEAIAEGDLVLISSEHGVILEEQPLVLESDDHSAYLSPEASTKVLTLNIRNRGIPFAGSLEFRHQIDKSSNIRNLPAPPQDALNVTYENGTAIGGSTFSVPVQNGRVVAQLHSNDKDAVLTLLIEARDPTTGQATITDTGVRIFQEEDFSNPPAADRDWEHVYNNVLKYYDYVFPAMSKILDLGDEAVVRERAQALISVVDTVPFDSPRYMPVTRSLSPARRQLLVDWLKAHGNVAGS